jgi:hypothetical protein
VRPLPRPARYVLLAAGFFILAVAGIVVGTVADAHRLSGLSRLGAIVFALGFAVTISLLCRAYFIGVSVPSLGQQMAAMVRAMQTGQPASGSFWAGLRDLTPTSTGGEDASSAGSEDPFTLPGQSPRLARWLTGRLVITPESVMWRRTAGRARNLTGAKCTGERRPEAAYTEMTLTKPRLYRGEPLTVIMLHVNGSDVELVTQVQLAEIVRYSLARTRPIHGNATGRVDGSSETSK